MLLFALIRQLSQWENAKRSVTLFKPLQSPQGEEKKRGAIFLFKIAQNDASWEKQQQAEATLGCQ